MIHAVQRARDWPLRTSSRIIQARRSGFRLGILPEQIDEKVSHIAPTPQAVPTPIPPENQPAISFDPKREGADSILGDANGNVNDPGRIAYIKESGDGPWGDCEWTPTVKPGQAYF